MLQCKELMEYSFSLKWFIIGIIVTLAGLALTRFFKQASDNFGAGLATYNKFRLAGIIVTSVGILMVFNLHTLLLDFIAHVIFGALIKN